MKTLQINIQKTHKVSVSKIRVSEAHRNVSWFKESQQMFLKRAWIYDRPMLFVYRNNELIFEQEKAPELLPDLVNGIRSVAKSFYNDDVIYIEKNGLSISMYISHTGVMFLWMCKEKGMKTLKKYYELYARAMVYGDIELFRMWCRRLASMQSTSKSSIN